MQRMEFANLWKGMPSAAAANVGVSTTSTAPANVGGSTPANRDQSTAATGSQMRQQKH